MSTFSALTGDSAVLLRPVVALNVWTLVMEGWMYATRLPAMSKYNVDTNPSKIKKDMETKLPPSIAWVADNYNHLMEQPTQYYAVVLTLALLGANDKTNVRLAWTYVGIRMVHSLVQSTINKVMLRFGLFSSSSAVLAVLTARTAALLF